MPVDPNGTTILMCACMRKARPVYTYIHTPSLVLLPHTGTTLLMCTCVSKAGAGREHELSRLHVWVLV